MIRFNTITWKNLLSTGNNPTTIDLSASHNTLVMGENGSGKSTLLDALTFVLFGKPFRKINKPQLVSSVNQSDCFVELEFTIGSKQYTVQRGIKPSIFKIIVDGSEIPQPASAKDYQDLLESQILKFNYKSFTQVVILGSSTFVPFMQLPAAARREIIEDLLDIQIFTSMNSILKERMLTHKQIISNVNHEIEMKEQYINIQNDVVAKMEKSNNKETEDIKIKIQDQIEEIDAYTFAINQSNKNLEQFKSDPFYQKLNDNQDKNNEYLHLQRKLSEKIKSIDSHIEFLHDTEDCPTCEQTLGSVFKDKSIDRKRIKKDEIKKAIAEINDKIKEIQKKIDKGLKIKQDIDNETAAQNSIISKRAAAKTILANLEEWQKTVTEKQDTSQLIDDIKAAKNVVIELNKKKEELSKDTEIYNITSGLLKDNGIKTLIIKQYLPVMNELINQYLAKMDFFVSFTLDENFNETIKSRHRDDFTYASFSEGEKARINLALLLTWRAVAKLKNSVNTNLLILDEIFDSSLDQAGTEELIKILWNLNKSDNVFIISHKSDQMIDKFQSTLKFEKVKGFSQIVQ